MDFSEKLPDFILQFHGHRKIIKEVGHLKLSLRSRQKRRVTIEEVHGRQALDFVGSFYLFFFLMRHFFYQPKECMFFFRETTSKLTTHLHCLIPLKLVI